MSWQVAFNEPEIEIAKKSFRKSEISLTLDELRNNPNWLSTMALHYEKSHQGLRHWLYLAGLQSVSSSLPPIAYSGAPIRSCFHLLLKGNPGGGKGFIMDRISTICPNVHSLGKCTSDGLLGAIDRKGLWVPGKAYFARNGVLVIRELFQSLRSGEHYESISMDLNELCEYPHEVSKTVISSKVANTGEMELLYDGVTFPSPNEFRYNSKCSVIAGVPEMTLRDLLLRVSEGFLSRFIELPIGYSRVEAKSALNAFWDNVLLPEVNTLLDPESLFTRCFFILHASALGGLYRTGFNIPPIRGFNIPIDLRTVLRKETLRALDDAWGKIEQAVKEGKLFGEQEEPEVPPPILFRECGDVLRIAVADAASRRFSGTENPPGMITVDKRAIETALLYLSVIVETRVKALLESRRIAKFRVSTRPSIMSAAFEVVRSRGPQGIGEEELENTLINVYGVSKRRAKKEIENLKISNSVVVKEGKLVGSTFFSNEKSYPWA